MFLEDIKGRSFELGEALLKADGYESFDMRAVVEDGVTIVEHFFGHQVDETLFFYRSKYIERPDSEPEPYKQETWGWNEIHGLVAKDLGIEAPCYKSEDPNKKK